MNHQEFSEAVRSLREGGVRLEQHLQVDASEIAQWESGEQKIPRIRARQISWLLRDAENRRRVREANLPRCEWAGELRTRRLSQMTGSPQTAAHNAENFLRELAAHTPSCEVCRSNEQWSKRHLEDNGSFPLPGLGGRILAVMSLVPPRLAPAAIGAMLLCAVTAVPVGFKVLAVLIRFPGISEVLSSLAAGAFAIGISALGGAAGGLAISILRVPVRRLGVVGHYLAWIAAVEAFVFTMTFGTQVALGEPLLEALGDWKRMAGFGFIFGILTAFAARRTEAHRKPVTT